VPALPPYAYPQSEITAELSGLITHDASKRAVLERFHAASGIGTRHTVLPLERYRDLHSFGDANDIWIQEGTALAARAVGDALRTAGLQPEDVDYLFFTSVTGIAAPSIDARLVPALGLRGNVKRVPSFGLGCVAGAAGLARVHDYLMGHPREIAVLVSVELCSLTLQQDDDSMANFVASGLFGDGAAAVVLKAVHMRDERFAGQARQRRHAAGDHRRAGGDAVGGKAVPGRKSQHLHLGGEEGELALERCHAGAVAGDVHDRGLAPVGGELLRASCEHEDLRNAITDVKHELERQIKKFKERNRDLSRQPQE